MIISKRRKKLRIFTHSKLISALKSFLETTFIFAEKLEFEVEFISYNFDETVTISESFNFVAKQNSHIRNKHNINNPIAEFISSSFLFKINNKNVVYTSDIGRFDDLFLFKEISVDLFIAESTHVTLDRIEDAITKLNPPQVFLTHIEHDEKLQTWYENLDLKQKKLIRISEDGMKINL
jgi:hypothetical protein